MHPAVKSQVSAMENSNAISNATALDEDYFGESLTRQEQAADTDVNTIIEKFGAGAFTRQPIFGNVDFDRNLQDAYNAIEAAQRLWASMPDKLRKRYNSQEAMTEALINGDLAKAIQDELESKQEEPNAPPKPPEVTP